MSNAWTQYGRSAHEGLMTVRRAGLRRDAETYALVLTAAAIPCALVDEHPGYSLRVDPANAARAFAEIAAYDRENPAERPGRVALVVPSPPVRIEGLMIAITVLLFFFAATRNGAFGMDWLAAGAAVSKAILDGEVWRAVTALTLHADGGHLLGNLLFGNVVGLLLAQVAGLGVALLAMLVTAAGGNLLNALLSAPDHGSIGASTAVFAGIGLLTGLRQDWRPERLKEVWRMFVPLAGGIMLLAMTGFANDGKTDIMAHVLGFVAGLAGGFVLASVDQGFKVDARVQWLSGITAMWIIAAAWIVALSV